MRESEKDAQRDKPFRKLYNCEQTQPAESLFQYVWVQHEIVARIHFQNIEVNCIHGMDAHEYAIYICIDAFIYYLYLLKWQEFSLSLAKSNN